MQNLPVLPGGRLSRATRFEKFQNSITNLTVRLRGFRPQAPEQSEPGGLIVRLRDRRDVGSYRKYRVAVTRSGRSPSTFSVEIVRRDGGSARPSTLRTSIHDQSPSWCFTTKGRSGKCGMVSALSLVARVGQDVS
jgi:hypothetical protein